MPVIQKRYELYGHLQGRLHHGCQTIEGTGGLSTDEREVNRY